MLSKYRNYIVPVLWIALLIFNLDLFFFWDTIQLTSKQASWFYENNFSSFFLPEEINSGHPPFFGLLIALIWSLFGRNLIIGHLVMMVIISGTIFQAHKLGEKLISKERAFLFPLIMFCNPYFLGHSILVSPDNLLIFCFLWALNNFLSNRTVYFSFACLFLAMISMRGMMLIASFFVGELIYSIIINRSYHIRSLTKYIISGLFALLFFGWHFYKNRWIGFHEESPWRESFDLVTMKGFLYNIGLIGWRILDFGNVFIVTPLIILMLRIKKSDVSQNMLKILFLIVGLLLILGIPLSMFKFLTNHRYFMPIILILSFSFVVFAIKYQMKKLILVCLTLLFLGNWWIYPRTISQGWDVSLGHLPFYELVEKMNNNIRDKGINPGTVGTEFPLKSNPNYIYLDKTKNAYKEAEIEKDHFILYSRIMNDFKEVDLQYINDNFKVVEEYRKGFIELILYERN